MAEEKLKGYWLHELIDLGIPTISSDYDWGRHEIFDPTRFGYEQVGFVRGNVIEGDLVHKGYLILVYRNRESGKLVAQTRNCVPF